MGCPETISLPIGLEVAGKAPPGKPLAILGRILDLHHDDHGDHHGGGLRSLLEDHFDLAGVF